MREICLFFIFVTGCSSSLEGDRTVEDDLGRIVHLPSEIERIAPLAPSITELLFASGAGSRVVGVSTVDDFPPAVNSLPKYSLIPMDFEAIVALDLDLVVASEQVNQPKDADLFAKVGIPVYFVAVNTLEDVTRAIRDLGELFSTSEFANHRATELEDSLAVLSALTEDLLNKPDVLFLIEHTTLYAFGQGSHIHDMIHIAGGSSITSNLSTRFPILTDEFVLTSMPDVIAGSFGEEFENFQLLSSHPTWDIVPAVRSNRVYGFDSAYFLRPGPRLVKGTWEIARVLHPLVVTDL